MAQKVAEMYERMYGGPYIHVRQSRVLLCKTARDVTATSVHGNNRVSIQTASVEDDGDSSRQRTHLVAVTRRQLHILSQPMLKLCTVLPVLVYATECQAS